MGEVNIRFSTETFPLDRLTDPALLQVITGHATPTRAPEAPKGATSPEAKQPETSTDNPESKK